MQQEPYIATQLAEALASHDFVEMMRHGIESGFDTHGFVLGVGPDILLIEVFGDRFDLDGYEALRLSDIASFERQFERKKFYLEALRVQSIAPCAPKGIELGNWREVVTSVSKNYPLIVVHRERLLPGECDIGRPTLVSDDGFALKSMDPRAEWDSDMESYRFRDITKISFGGAYESVLALVAEKRTSVST